MTVEVALVQESPIFLDLEGSLRRTVELMKIAAAKGARLVVFPEAFLPGYPVWIWQLRPGADMSTCNKIHAVLRQNAVDLRTGGLDAVRSAAAEHGIVVVIGINEIDSEFSGTTLFNTVVTIDSDGKILNRHRKLVLTNPERMVWGQGDAGGLRVVDTAVGRIGGLICWENYMPLARHALFSQNIEIYIAPTWDHGETWVASMNHVAREGGCWVLSVAMAVQGNDVPVDVPDRNLLFNAEDEWLCPGGALVVRPFGGVVAGPLHEKKDILYETIDTESSRRSRKTLDVAGHYGRPDIFNLEVDRRPRKPTHFADEIVGPELYHD